MKGLMYALWASKWPLEAIERPLCHFTAAASGEVYSRHQSYHWAQDCNLLRESEWVYVCWRSIWLGGVSIQIGLRDLYSMPIYSQI